MFKSGYYEKSVGTPFPRHYIPAYALNLYCPNIPETTS